MNRASSARPSPTYASPPSPISPPNCLATAESGTYACISNGDLNSYSATSYAWTYSGGSYVGCEACTEKGLVYAWTRDRGSLWTAAIVQTLFAGVGGTCSLPTPGSASGQSDSCSSAS